MDMIPLIRAIDAASADALRGLLPQAREAAAAGSLARACQTDEPGVADGATWLVKALLEEGAAGQLDPWQVFEALETADSWPAQLHLLQSVQFAPDAALDRVGAIRALQESRKTLVRVWALDALVRVALVRQELLAEARAAMDAGLNDKAASMRARCRALDKLLKSSE